jgi:hypothetical protein
VTICAHLHQLTAFIMALISEWSLKHDIECWRRDERNCSCCPGRVSIRHQNSITTRFDYDSVVSTRPVSIATIQNNPDTHQGSRDQLGKFCSNLQGKAKGIVPLPYSRSSKNSHRRSTLPADYPLSVESFFQINTIIRQYQKEGNL